MVYDFDWVMKKVTCLIKLILHFLFTEMDHQVTSNGPLLHLLCYLSFLLQWHSHLLLYPYFSIECTTTVCFLNAKYHKCSPQKWSVYAPLAPIGSNCYCTLFCIVLYSVMFSPDQRPLNISWSLE